MSIMVLYLVPEGLLFAADRNITTQRLVGGLMHIGQSQRPKVLKWPNREAIIGYVGAGRIGETPTDQWLYAFIGRNLNFPSFDPVAESLTRDLNDALTTGLLPPDEPLVIHLGGFEQVRGECTPVIWFIHNTTGLTPEGFYLTGTQFARSEEIRRPIYYGERLGSEIRQELSTRVRNWGLFSFRQGYDLGSFNAMDGAIRQAMRAIVETHPLKRHPFPTTLQEWSKHVRMAVLAYGAYFNAFYEPYEQYVGGGADVVWAAWP